MTEDIIKSFREAELENEATKAGKPEIIEWAREVEERKEEDVRNLEASTYCDHETALKVTLRVSLENLRTSLKEKGMYYQKDMFIKIRMIESCCNSYMQLSKTGDTND